MSKEGAFCRWQSPDRLNKLPEKISGLAEGLSIRSLERIFGTNRETIMRYQLLVGKGCHYLMDAVMRYLEINSVQVDEFWSFVYKKQARRSTMGRS